MGCRHDHGQGDCRETALRRGGDARGNGGDSLKKEFSWEKEWWLEAARLAPRLWPDLLRAGVKSAAVFDAMADLSVLERSQELCGLIPSRDVQEEDLEEFRVLITAAERHAGKRRKVLLKALGQPGMRVDEQVLEEIYTPGDLMRASLVPRVDLAAGLYPSASSRPAEDREGKRHLIAVQIGQIISDCGLPPSHLMLNSVTPERYLGRFGAGRRLSTLRNKVRIFLKLQKWMIATYQKPMPTRPVEILDYILDRGDEPCGPSVPGTILSTLAFFEEVGGVVQSARL